MVEPIMYFGAGFLIASLFGIIFIPLVHARAVRLTRRRIQAQTPLSMAEIKAEKDQLRAEFAMNTRRLEMSLEQMKAKAAGHMAELGKKSEAVSRLKAELAERVEAIAAMQERDRAARDQLRATEEEIAQRIHALREAEQHIADKEAELARLFADLEEQSTIANRQRIEIVTLQTQVEALKNRVGDFQYALRQSEQRLADEQRETEEVARALAAERAKVANLDRRVIELERQRLGQSTEAELLAKRVQELGMRLTEQGRLLDQREHQYEQLTAQLANAKLVEADLRSELAGFKSRQEDTEQALRHEKALLQEQLARVSEERSRLQRELAGAQRNDDTSWAAEQVDDALLRDQISQIAAEIARLTATIEGPNSPIERMLAEDAAPRPAFANAPAAAAAGGGSAPPRNGVSLADRIRALKTQTEGMVRPT